MSTNKHIVTAITMPGRPDAWKSPRVMALIDRLRRSGVSVSIAAPAAMTQLLLEPEGRQRVVRMTEPDKDGMQWSIR